MSHNLSKEQILTSLQAKGIDVVAGESSKQFVQRMQNQSLLDPRAKPVTVAFDKQAIIAKATAIDIARERTRREAEEKAAEANKQYEGNPLAQLLASSNVQLNKKQRKHLEKVAAQRAEELETQRKEEERVRTILESPEFASALATAERWVDIVPPEFKEEAAQNLATLKASLSVRDFYDANTAFAARVRTAIDAKLQDVAAAATTKSAEAQSLNDQLTRVESE
jgi:hypothetical protein